jgi:hypothetical protein
LTHQNYTAESFVEVAAISNKQRWAPALFSRFRACEREVKKRARKREEKRAQKEVKTPSAERERKKARILAFSSPNSGNPVSEPKAARQGESKGLE